MRILLTGANGFVGSHILDRLCAGGCAVSALLRPTSRIDFIAEHLPHLDVRPGALSDPDSLQRALQGVDCVIHCAGKTKVVRTAEYYEVNETGTRNLVCAINGAGGSVKHFIHISSLAANHPAGPDAPALESDAPQPVSEYGKSKLRAELAVREICQAPFTILRPAAVYGPRDADFLSIFQAVRWHVAPLIGGGRMPLSVIYAGDVAEAVVACVENPAAYGKTYHLAAPEPCTTREFMREAAAAMNVRTLSLPVPLAALYPLCLAQELLTRITGKPGILTRQKLTEMKACGWVCSTELMRRDLHFSAAAPLREGIARTVDWYEQNGWL